MIKCINCGTENSAEAKFCSRCGVKMLSEEESLAIFQQREKQYQEALALKLENDINRHGNTALILALLGLILDFVFGMGFILSAISLVFGLKYYRATKKQIFLWSIFLGLLGFVFGIIYLCLMVII